MDDDQNKLTPPQRGLTAVSEISSTLSRETIAVEVHLSSLNSKSEPPVELIQEFIREFQSYPPGVVQWAFHEQRRASPHFPTIAEIYLLANQRKRQIWDEQEAERRRVEFEETEKARAEGRLLDYAEVRQLIADIAKKIPDLESPKARDMRERAARMQVFETPALHLTPEQIMQRVEAERNDPKVQAELQHYREKFDA